MPYSVGEEGANVWRTVRFLLHPCTAGRRYVQWALMLVRHSFTRGDGPVRDCWGRCKQHGRARSFWIAELTRRNPRNGRGGENRNLAWRGFYLSQKSRLQVGDPGRLPPAGCSRRFSDRRVVLGALDEDSPTAVTSSFMTGAVAPLPFTD